MDAVTRRDLLKLASAEWRSSIRFGFLWIGLILVLAGCSQSTSYPRSIYFKLPLEQTEFHWVFQERDQFLSGNLTLGVKGKSRSEEITVFEDGKLSEGWQEIKGGPGQAQNQVYFGFVSHKMYPVSEADEVEISLRVLRDLKGIGPDKTGILKAGEYKAKSKFTVYWTDNDTAYLRKADATPQWKLIITENKGWMDSQGKTR